MANLQNAEQKYARKTQGAGGRWKANATAAAGQQCEGVAEFLGVSPAQVCASAPAQNFRQGIAATDASVYDRGVAGKAGKWSANLRRAYGS